MNTESCSFFVDQLPLYCVIYSSKVTGLFTPVLPECSLWTDRQQALDIRDSAIELGKTCIIVKKTLGTFKASRISTLTFESDVFAEEQSEAIAHCTYQLIYQGFPDYHESDIVDRF